MKNYYGIEGIKFIWHGEWSDPELEYKGYVFSVYDVEDFMYDRFTEENGSQVHEAFAKYMKEHEEDVKEVCELIIESMEVTL